MDRRHGGAADERSSTGPDAATASRSATFTYSGDALGGTAIAGYECRLDDGAWGTCRDYADLADGEHRFQVRALDAAGNADASPAAHTWTVDTVEPDTEVTRSPGAATSERTAAFEYRGLTLGGTDIARFECRLDAGAWGACRDYADLADGEHRFQVRAIDAAGNADTSPAGHTWTVDTIAPQTAIGTGPDAVTASRMAAFTYSGDAARRHRGRRLRVPPGRRRLGRVPRLHRPRRGRASLPGPRARRRRQRRRHARVAHLGDRPDGADHDDHRQAGRPSRPSARHASPWRRPTPAARRWTASSAASTRRRSPRAPAPSRSTTCRRATTRSRPAPPTGSGTSRARPCRTVDGRRLLRRRRRGDDAAGHAGPDRRRGQRRAARRRHDRRGQPRRRTAAWSRSSTTARCATPRRPASPAPTRSATRPPTTATRRPRPSR